MRSSARPGGSRAMVRARWSTPSTSRSRRSASWPAGVSQMLAALRVWYASGTHRILSAADSTQYQQAAAVAISDQLMPAVIKAIFDPLFAAGGTNPNGYNVFPMGFVNEPDNGGAHLGSAYDGGWEGYTVKALDQMTGQPVAQPFSSAVTARLCGTGGLSHCGPALDAALKATYQALVKANGGSTNVASWTQDANTVATGLTMPAYDAIGFRALGIVGQPALQLAPLPQQRLVGRLDGGLAARGIGVGGQQALFDKMLQQGPAFGGYL